MGTPEPPTLGVASCILGAVGPGAPSCVWVCSAHLPRQTRLHLSQEVGLSEHKVEGAL